MLPQAADLLRKNVHPLPPLTDPTFSNFINKVANNKIILLGDASHGPSEFYTARAKISQYLIQHHGFNIVAVEADYPDAEAVDRYVRRRPGVTTSIEVTEKEPAFERFPRWMWRNHEEHDFVEWLREHNKGLSNESKAGFYGLDLYSMGTSMDAVVKYLDHIDPKMAKVARQRYGALQPWVEHPQEYGLAALLGAFKSCERDVLGMLKDLLGKRLEYAAHLHDGEEFQGTEQNARVVAGRHFPQFLNSNFLNNIKQTQSNTIRRCTTALQSPGTYATRICMTRSKESLHTKARMPKPLFGRTIAT
jgi:erythromycin esterase-like protein